MEFILLILVLVLLFWVGSVSNRVAELEIKLKTLAQRSTKPLDIPEPITASVPEPQNNIFQSTAKLDLVKAQEEQMAPQDPLSESLKPSAAQDVADATGWLNKIGVVALLLGMVFFFKYAIDQGWITPWMRIIIGFLVSGLLVYLGELWKEKYGSRAFALSGGGIALFYFCIYAAYQYYQLMPQPVAWVLMLCGAGAAIYLSFRYSSLVLGVLGFIGAYGSPLMLGSNTDQQISLFVFLTLMNLAVLVIATRKFWVPLLFLAGLGTIIDFSAWASTYSNHDNTFTSLFFVIFTAALLAISCSVLLRYHQSKNTLPEMVTENLSAVYLLLGGFYFVAIYFLLNQNFYSMLAGISLLGSVLFFFAYAIIDRLEYRGINYTLSFIGSWLLVYAAIWQYDGKALAFALLLIAILGVTLGFLLKREELRVWSLFILFGSLFKSLYEPYTDADKVFLFNAKFGLMFANTLAMLFVGWMYSKIKASEFEKNAEAVLQVVAAAMFWLAVSWDMMTGLDGTGFAQNYMTFWWVLYPVALITAAFMSKRSGLVKLGILLLIASLIKVLVLPYGYQTEFLLNAKFGLMTFEAVALIFVGWLYAKNGDAEESTSDTLYVVGSLFFWFTMSWEIVNYFSSYGSENTRNLLLSLWWIGYAVILLVVSAITKIAIFRKVTLGLFALAIVKVFLYDVQTLDTPYRIIAFIVLGVILLTVSFSYNRNKEKIVNFLEGEKK